MHLAFFPKTSNAMHAAGTACSNLPPGPSIQHEWQLSQALKCLDAAAHASRASQHDAQHAWGLWLAPACSSRRPDPEHEAAAAACRYIVVPERPAGTEGWSEEDLAALVTRDSIIGVEPARSPDAAAAKAPAKGSAPKKARTKK